MQQVIEASIRYQVSGVRYQMCRFSEANTLFSTNIR